MTSRLVAVFTVGCFLSTSLGIRAEGVVEGNTECLRYLLSSYREADSLYPRGRLVADIRTENMQSEGTTEASVTAYWDKGLARIEAHVRSSRREGQDLDLVFVHRGTERLYFAVPPRFARYDKAPVEAPIGYLACIPRHCWFGRDEALLRPWSWRLDYKDHDSNRVSHVASSEDTATLTQTVSEGGEQVASMTAVFDLKANGMCKSYQSTTARVFKSGSAEWRLDDSGRPVLNWLKWRKEFSATGQHISFELRIKEFDPDAVIPSSLFNFEHTQFPADTIVTDERGSTPNTFRIGGVDPLARERELRKAGEKLREGGFSAEDRRP